MVDRSFCWRLGPVSPLTSRVSRRGGQCPRVGRQGKLQSRVHHRVGLISWVVGVDGQTPTMVNRISLRVRYNLSLLENDSFL